MTKKNEMTVDELRDALSYMDGRRIVKIWAHGGYDADIAEVHEDEVSEDRPVATVTIVTSDANQHLKTLLDAFFSNRLPIEAPGYYRMTYTTEDIQDMLVPMMNVDKGVLMDYMANNGYQIHQQPDSTPRWVMFTKMNT